MFNKNAPIFNFFDQQHLLIQLGGAVHICGDNNNEW